MTKQDFCKEFQNWTSYLPLLWQALEATIGEVVEMGMGSGSTPVLHKYCEGKRDLFSYDNDFKWSEKFTEFESATHKVIHTIDWDLVSRKHSNPSVVLIDHAPGNRRKFDIELFAEKAKILVIHDSEIAGWNASDYQVRPVIEKFKYVIDLKPVEGNGAWASACSNFIDVTKFEI